MAASITLNQLSYATPDGRLLFSNLDLSFGPVRTGLVGRNGVGKSTLLRLITGSLAPASGSVVVTGTPGVLEQTVQIGPETTIAGFAGVEVDLQRLERLERGAGTVDDAAEADWTLPSRFSAALAEIGLGELDPDRPVASLSGGQRTRLALAGLLLQKPDMLLLDEPTNNLDSDGRAAVAALLGRWRGGAIVVSHDRTLLRRMDQIVELTSLGATVYGGNWDHFSERKALELAAAEHGLATAERQLAEIERRNQAQAERKAKRDGAGRRQAARGGQPRIVAGGLQRRAQQTAGDNARLASRLREQASEAASEARQKFEVLQPFRVSLPATGLPGGRNVLQASGLTGGPVAGQPLIRELDLSLNGPERVAITGPNGAGKTTLLRLLTGELAPTAGTISIFVSHALLDQTVSLLDPAETIRENYRRLHPDDDENSCRAALARFKFRAEAALQQVGSLSGGEMLRAGLAVTIGASNPPQLLILDEPTNHLDLESIEAVEAGLGAYDGALLVVSHDREFLTAIGVEREVVLSAA